MSTRPYREPDTLVLVPLSLGERLLQAGCERFVSCNGPCPKCKSPHPENRSYLTIMTHKACRGSFFGSCRIEDFHLHARCRQCKATWLMLPADVSL